MMIIQVFIIWLILFGLSGCITSKEKKVVSNKVTNNQTIIDLSQNKFKNNIEKYKVIQWKCYKSHWLTKYKQLLLTVEYFPEFKKFDQNSRIGMLLLNNTKSKKLAVYSQQGVQHYWDWGGVNFNNYQIIIHPSGNGWFYDFENKKSNEEQSPKETAQKHAELIKEHFPKTKKVVYFGQCLGSSKAISTAIEFGADKLYTTSTFFDPIYHRSYNLLKLSGHKSIDALTTIENAKHLPDTKLLYKSMDAEETSEYGRFQYNVGPKDEIKHHVVRYLDVWAPVLSTQSYGIFQFLDNDNKLPDTEVDLDFEESNEGYSTSVGARIHLSTRYHMSPKLTLGTNYYRASNTINSRYLLSVNCQYKTLPWLSIGTGYGISSNSPILIPLNTMFHIGFVDFYMSTENILSGFSITKSNVSSVKLGLQLGF